MAYVAKLTRGNRTLDLSSGRYSLADDFVPPTTTERIQTSGGTATNRFGGANRVGMVAVNSSLSFGINIAGSSAAEIEQAINDVDKFLRQAGDESDPLYFEWRPDNNVPAEPIWGQFGAYLRSEVIWGAIYKPQDYGSAGQRTTLLTGVPVEMEIKPYARGLSQRVGSAKGFVWENNIFSEDGLNAGLHIGEAITNQHTNPIFGHATFDNGWTPLANLTVSKNTDKRFRLFGKASAKLTSRSTTLSAFTQSVTIGGGGYSASSVSYYVKLPDGGPVSSTQIDIIYDSVFQTTIYTEVSNGWWRISAIVAGTGAATNAGIRVKNGHTVYLDGAQATNQDAIRPLIHGYLLGCVWDGTAHASTSTATVAYLRFPAEQQIDVGGGTMLIVWKADNANTLYTVSANYLLRNITSNMALYFDGVNDRFTFTDGVNSANGVTRSFSIGDTFIIHCTWKKTNGIHLYINGIEDGSGNSTYTPPTLGAVNYLGSTAAPLLHIGGTFKGLSFYSHEMTAAQVLADYNNAQPLIADNQMLEPIPYRWTKDGDDIVDNAIQGTTYHNYAVFGGIPGNVPAETEHLIDVGTMGSETKLILAQAELDEWADPEGNYFRNAGGTATTSADVSSDVRTESVNTTNVFVTALTDINYFDPLAGRSLALIARLSDAGANLTAATFWDLTGANTVLTDFKAIAADATRRVFVLDNILVPTKRDLLAHRRSSLIVLDNQVDIGVVLVRTSAGAANVTIDYVFLAPRPLLELTYSGLSASDFFLISGREAYIVQASGTQYNLTGKPATVGRDPLELLPNKVNILFSLLGGDGEANTITRTLTYVYTDIIPRYAIA